VATVTVWVDPPEQPLVTVHYQPWRSL
jgi:hypothetical protein